MIASIAEFFAQLDSASLVEVGFKGGVISALVVVYRDMRKCFEDRSEMRRDIEELKRKN